MKFKLELICGFIILLLGVSSCANNPEVTSPSPCATAVTLSIGQTTLATLSPDQPTFSPEMQATAEARLRQANPGISPYPGIGQAALPATPCPTNTPLSTPRPQTPTGGVALRLTTSER